MTTERRKEIRDLRAEFVESLLLAVRESRWRTARGYQVAIEAMDAKLEAHPCASSRTS